MSDNLSGSILRVATAGSVDDGKSTLVGRLLYDSNSICDDHLRSLRVKGANGNESLALAMLTDGLKSEREQHITIDVAYRYFSTAKRHFILADAPGHEQYTRNMVTAASTADVLIILVDATKGIVTQTKRHSFIGALMGVPRLLITVNKMDLVGYDQEKFEALREEYLEFAAKLSVKDIRFIPVSALHGGNVVTYDKTMPWYSGETVLGYLESVYIGADKNLIDFRFPVQHVIRPHQNFRGYAGQISSGSIHPGDDVIVLPSKNKAKVKSILMSDKNLSLIPYEEAYAPLSVVIELDNDIDVARGDMIVRSSNTPRVVKDIEAMMVWMGDAPLDSAKLYIIRHTTREVRGTITNIRYGVDVNTLHRKKKENIEKNEVFCATFSLRQPIFVDDYRLNRATGCFILIDPDDYFTVGAGMVIERLKSDPPDTLTSYESSVLHEDKSAISRSQRENKAGHRAFTLWLTGLSGAGKSTIAGQIEKLLFVENYIVCRLDGDNIRARLNKDLGFSDADRSENIRRVAEVASLLNSAGVSVICSFISPFEIDRAKAKEIIGRESFLEIFIKASLQTCEARDPHGLYKRARGGKINQFTGISSPYEEPTCSWEVINTETTTASEAAMLIVEKFKKVSSLL